MKPITIAIRTLTASCLMALTCHSASAETVLRLAENQSENNPFTIAMHRFGDLVDQYSAGEIKVKVFSGAQLGQETETIEQTQAGIIDMTGINSVTLANVTPKVGVFTLPFIYRNNEHKIRRTRQ